MPLLASKPMRSFRRFARFLHLWLGLIAGLFICLMGVTGGLVALRPQIAMWLAPSAPRSTGCISDPDWNGAARQVTAATHSEINRIYGPYGADTRYHFRMATDEDAIYRHVIYDACSGQVLGLVDLAWMDWTVDLHHNLLAGRTGRRWAGWIGVVMLISAVSGFLVWLMGKPSLSSLRVSGSLSRTTPRQLHRLGGLTVSIFLLLEAFTGLWLCFPQTMRGLLAMVSPISQDVRPARGSRIS